MASGLISLEPRDFTELQNVAKVFAESGLFSDARSMAQAFVKIMAGREVGIGAFAAMQGIYIVSGKPTYSANIMAAAIKRNPKYDYRVVELSDLVCEIVFYEAGEKIGLSRLTMNEAQKANMHQSWDKTKNKWEEKITWKNFPKNMLFARAMSNGVRWYCPDVFDMPVYTPDEMGAVIDDENIIDGSIIERQEPVTPKIIPLPSHERIIGRDPEIVTGGESAADTLPINGNGKLYDPASDHSEMNSRAWDTLRQWLVSNQAECGGQEQHAVNAFRKAIHEAGYIDSVDAKWPQIFNCGLTVAKAHAAIQAHYAEPPQEPPAVTPITELDPYDPAKDERALNKETCRDLADWMAHNIPSVESLSHATNAIKLSLTEAGLAAASETWPTIYSKDKTVAQTYAAVQVHYEKKNTE